jgi:hypothetical protein
MADDHNPILQPVEGISLEAYATTQARAASMGADTSKWPQILAQAGMDQAKWERVSAEWTRRMSGQAGDMNAAMAVITAYGAHYAKAQGQTAAPKVTPAASAPPAGEEPCTLEYYAEVMGAQTVWNQQGRDVATMLRKQFGLTANDFAALSQYWSARIGADYHIAVRLDELQSRYVQDYLSDSGATSRTP